VSEREMHLPLGTGRWETSV